jgi:NADH dehydrogenase FAD-containing subunit
MHNIVIVGGGAGGLELATRLGRAYRRDQEINVTLVDKNRTHIWKPKLHEIASGSMDFGDHEVDVLVFVQDARTQHSWVLEVDALYTCKDVNEASQSNSQATLKRVHDETLQASWYF